MNDELKPGIECTEFDALLSEAIDGTLAGEQLALFEQHRKACPACEALFAEVRAGADWMGELEEMEPPRHLVHNILAATSGVMQETTQAALAPSRSFWERLTGSLRPMLASTASARFAMSAATAFFSITLVMNMTGTQFSDLTPHKLERKYYTTQAKVVKYYENMRVVYQLESRVRDLRRATSGAEGQNENKDAQPDPRSDRDKRNSNEPEQQKDREQYSKENAGLILASLPERQAPDVLVARQRRIV